MRDDILIPDFLRDIVSQKHESEDSLDNLAENRASFCQAVSKHFNVTVDIWLCYESQKHVESFCYYSSRSLETLSMHQKSVVSELSAGAETHSQKIVNATKEWPVSPNNVKVDCHPVRLSWSDNGAWPLGWLVLSSDPDTQIDCNILEIALSVLALKIQLSREARLGTWLTALSSDFQEPIGPKERLRNVMTRLLKFGKFEIAAVVSGDQIVECQFSNAKHLSIDNYTDLARGLQQALHSDQELDPDNEELGVIPFFFKHHEMAKDDPVEIPKYKNSLALKLQGTFMSIEERKFSEDDFRLGTQLPNGAGNQYLFLAARNDRAHFGTISPTEQRVCRAIQAQLSQLTNEHVLINATDDVSRWASSLNPEGPGLVHEILQILNRHTTQINRVYMLRYNVISTQFESVESAGSDSTAALPASYLRRLLNTMNSYVQETQGEFRTTVRAGAAIAEGRSFLEYHISTHYEPGRLIVFETISRSIDEVTLKLIKRLVREIDTHYRKLDVDAERSALMIQIRHAIIDSNAATIHAVTLASDVAKRARSSAAGWADLREDVEFFDALDQGLNSAQDSMLVAETGRYLFSRLQFEQLKSDHYRIDELVRSVLRTYRFQLNARRMKTVWREVGRRPEAFPFMTGDYTLLRIAIANLIDNGIKYGIRNTPLMIEIHYHPDYYRCLVSNTAMHLSAASKGRLFAAFSRGPQDNLNKKHGTGIGLPVTAMILELHGDGQKADVADGPYFGKLDYESTPNPNYKEYDTITFHFALPYRIGRISRRPRSYSEANQS